MKMEANTNYLRIAQAIEYLNENFKQQPTLAEVSSVVGLSPYYFQRLFTEWAGISPKNFIQYLSVEFAKKLLENNGTTLLDTAHETGLSGTGRLHDLFIKIEGMTPGEYKNGAQFLTIKYQFTQSPFGKLLVASTGKGICRMVFEEQESKALAELKSLFPKAIVQQQSDNFQQQAIEIFQKDWQMAGNIKLHLRATPFQLKVWESLLKIAPGQVTTYGALSKHINKPGASRAVGQAVGSNPVAFLIPCHRVIQATGDIGGYRWGKTRKTAILGWEAAQQALPSV